MRDGSGLLPDWESSWDVIVVAAAVTWRGTMFGVFRLDFDPYESSGNFDTGILHRIPSRIDLA